MLVEPTEMYDTQVIEQYKHFCSNRKIGCLFSASDFPNQGFGV